MFIHCKERTVTQNSEIFTCFDKIFLVLIILKSLKKQLFDLTDEAFEFSCLKFIVVIKLSIVDYNDGSV